MTQTAQAPLSQADRHPSALRGDLLRQPAYLNIDMRKMGDLPQLRVRHAPGLLGSRVPD